MQRVWHRKFDGCWYATFSEDGRQKQIKLLKGPNDKEHKKLAVQKLIDELKVRKPSTRKSAPDWLTVHGVLKGFLRHSRKTHERPTFEWYRYLLRGFNRFCGRLRVNQLRKKHIHHWLEKSGYNPTSQNRAVGAVKRAFNWAVEEEHIPENPIAHVRKPKALVRDRFLAPAERELILSSIRGRAFREFVQAMTLTGCRPGEVAKVSKSNVNLERGLWIFDKHKTAKKTGKPRIIYLCSECSEC